MKPKLKITETKIINGIKRRVVYREFGSYWCWICGEGDARKKIVTKHHLIPKCLKPFQQIIIPLCDKCHKKLHGLIKYTDEDK